MELLLRNSNQPTATKQPVILAVDDDEDNLLLLTEVLKPLDCTFITATNGIAAISLAQEHNPDLILLDVMLPDLNGMEVLHHLKNSLQTLAIPVVAVTALAREEDREQLFLAGCSEYISKPYILDDLEAVIRRYLPPT